MTNTSAAYIAGTLGADNYIDTYTVTFFALGNALGMPLCNPLISRLGAVRVLKVCLVLFLFASILCPLSQSFYQIILFRLLQGFFSGPLLPLANRILARMHEEHRDTLAIFTLQISAVTPIVSTSFAGWISYNFHWHWIFLVNVPFVLMQLYFFHFIFNKDIPIASGSFNKKNYAFYSIAIFCIVSAIILGQYLDWDRSFTVMSLFIVGGFFLIVYILSDVNHPSPILNLKLFKRFHFSFATSILSILFSSYFGMVLLLGLWLALDVNYTPDWIAFLIGIMGFASVFLGFLNSFFNRIDARIPLAISIFFFAISNFFTTQFAENIDFWRICVSRALASFGLAFFISPLQRICYDRLHATELDDGVVIFQVVRCISSGLGASIYTTMWWRRSVFFHERLGEQLTPFSELVKGYFLEAKLLNIQGKKAYAQLDFFLNKQAKALALNDVFYAMGWICTLALLALFLTYFRKEPLSVEAETLPAKES